MTGIPEDCARQQIERQLDAAGWLIQDASKINIAAGRGVVVREFSLAKGHGEADYLLYGDKKALVVRLDYAPFSV